MAEVTRLAHRIGEGPVAAQATAWDPVYDPATGAVTAEVPLDDTAAVAQAVAAAQAAFPAWAATPLVQRARVLAAWRALLEAHRAELAASITAEHGKTLADAAAEVGRGIEVVELAQAAPALLQSAGLPETARGLDTTVVVEPLGVVAGITPFNFPAMIPLWMVPLAVVAGNTVVLKPSERTPQTSLKLWALAREAGLPAGVFNVVLGGPAVVEALVTAPAVRAVSLVGSQPVAAQVYARAAAAGKRVQALGGAKNYHVVLPDADLERVVPALMQSAFGSAGERCLAGAAVVAVEPVGDALVAALAAAIDRWRVGDGRTPGVDMGPLIRPAHRARVMDYIARGVAEGARLVRDGRQGSWPPGGFFLGPTLFDAVQPAMTIAQEEIFGPVLAVLRAPDLATAVAWANGTRFGNTATVYTRTGAWARYFARHVQAGMVGINVGVAAPVGWFPFAGWKDSFYGDLHATGLDGLRFYTERRVIVTRWWDEPE